MPVSHVQRNQAQTASGTSHALAFSSNVTAGDLLVVTFAKVSYAGSISGVTDNLGDGVSWERAYYQVGSHMREFWCKVAGASGPCAVTGTSSSATSLDMGLFEASSTTGWPAAGSRVNVSGNNLTSATSHPCAASGLNTTVADAYGVTISAVASGFAPTQAMNWTGAASNRGYHQYRVYAATVSGETAAWTSAVTEDVAGAIVVFEAAAGGGPGSYTVDLVGTLALAGVLSRRTLWTKDGIATPGGSVLKAVGRSLAGASGPAGGVTKQTLKTVAGAAEASGSLVRRVGRTFAGTLVGAGEILKRVSRSLAGTAAASGTLATLKAYLLALGGTLSATGQLTKRTGRNLSGAATLAGALVKAVGRGLAGTTTASGTLGALKTKLLALAGTLVVAGTLTRQTGKPLAGSAAPAGSLTKRAGRSFAGSATLAGTLAAVRVVLLALAGAALAAGTLTKSVGKSLAGATGPAGALVKRVARSLAGVVVATASLLASHLPFGVVPWVSATLSRVRVTRHTRGQIQPSAPGQSRIVAARPRGSIRRVE